ncbi:MAG: hypothetical protein B7C24_10040, partial [Bacteroidetes bacterium 4572_77]
IENEKQNKNRRWLKFLAYMAAHIAGVAKLVGLRMARKRCCFTYTRGTIMIARLTCHCWRKENNEMSQLEFNTVSLTANRMVKR